jgi:hypothetical protein
MMTNQEWIDAALLELGIIEAGESADTEESATGLRAMNQMMPAMEQGDTNFNWFTQDTLTDIAPIPVWSEQGLISLLAIACAVPFRTPVDTFTFQKAAEGKNLILRTFINLKLEGADMSHLSLGYRRYYNSSILTDS